MFGGFGPSPIGVLCVLGWTRVSAITRGLSTLWRSDDVAIDGITWREQLGDRLLISCELDPPGGWVDVELGAETGQRVR